jgi:hypothetical protein
MSLPRTQVYDKICHTYSIALQDSTSICIPWERDRIMMTYLIASLVTRHAIVGHIYEKLLKEFNVLLIESASYVILSSTFVSN